MLKRRPPKRKLGQLHPEGYGASAHEIHDVISRMGEWNSEAGAYVPEIAARLLRLNLKVLTVQGIRDAAPVDDLGQPLTTGQPRVIIHVQRPNYHFLATVPLGQTPGVANPLTLAAGRDEALAALTAITNQLTALDVRVSAATGVGPAELADPLQLIDETDPILVARRELGNWIALARRLNAVIPPGVEQGTEKLIVAVAAAQASYAQLPGLIDKLAAEIFDGSNLSEPPSDSDSSDTGADREIARLQENVLRLAAEKWANGEPIILSDIISEAGYARRPTKLVKTIEKAIKAAGYRVIRRPKGATDLWDHVIWEAAWRHWNQGKLGKEDIEAAVAKAYPDMLPSNQKKSVASFKSHFTRLGYLGYLGVWPASRPKSGPGPSRTPPPRPVAGASRLSPAILAELLERAAAYTERGDPIVVHDLAHEVGYQLPFAADDLETIEKALEDAGVKFIRRRKHTRADQASPWYQVLREGARWHKESGLPLTDELIDELVLRFHAKGSYVAHLAKVADDLADSFAKLGMMGQSAGRKRRPAADSLRVKKPKVARKRLTRQQRRNDEGEAEYLVSLSDVEEVSGEGAVVDLGGKTAQELGNTWRVSFDSSGPTVSEVATANAASSAATDLDLRNTEPVTGQQVGWEQTDLSQAVVAVRARPPGSTASETVPRSSIATAKANCASKWRSASGSKVMRSGGFGKASWRAGSVRRT